jgi:hypothetical protein
MVDSAIRKQEYYCENCNSFDDEPIPSECRKGHGRVAYLHRICASFQLRNGVKAGSNLKNEG